MKKDGRYEKYRKMSDKEIKQLINKQEEIKEENSQDDNTLLELNKFLFDELRTLTDKSLSEEDLNRELKVSKQVVSVSQTIISNANLLLQAKKHIDLTKEDSTTVKLRRVMMSKKIFTEEHDKFIRNNATGLRNEELTKRFNEHFKTNFTVGQIKKYKNFHHISSGFKSCNLPIRK